MNWQIDESHLPNLVACAARSPERELTFRALIDGWRVSGPIRTEWAEVLRNLALDAYCWEMPPITARNLDDPFQCVFVNSPALASATPERTPFDEHFIVAERARASIAVFDSLGRDARLIAPCPRGDASSHTHIAAFHRRAQADQIDDLWAAVGAAMQSRIGEAPVWLSTAGLGVHWLHVRIDSRPKYYRHRPYADPGFWRMSRGPETTRTV